jgi:hypothetical protein
MCDFGVDKKEFGLPELVFSSVSEDFRKGLIDALFSADGNVTVSDQGYININLVTSKSKLAESVRELLGFYGIKTSLFKKTIDGSKHSFPNGKVYDKIYEVYTVSIIKQNSVRHFARTFKLTNLKKDNILDGLRQDDVYDSINGRIGIKSVEKTDIKEDVWDISVYDKTHCFQLSQCITGNCVEIGFWPVCEKTGKSGWQACNLSTINCSKVKDEVDFYEAAKAAAIIGTLQAGFTDVGYLEDTSKNILEREALIGVSMTGIMEQHEICLSPILQKEAAKIVKQVNKDIAKKIGINQAARCTCVKPEGTASCILGTSSGIHPHHAKRYIRRVQANKMEDIYKYFKSINPRACQESVWSANDTDDVISFCVEVPDGSKTKNQISAIDLLESVKSTQQNWVINGTNETLCTQPWLVHNVSNTINVKKEEWGEVEEFIYNNRKWFCGISLLPVTGDKDYPQAPFTAIYLPSKIISHYGDGAMFVSGLIEGALQLWEDNLWAACDSLLGIGTRPKGGAKQEWIARCEKFAGKYFQDIKSLTYCMKDVYNYKLWTELNKEYVDVDFKNVIEQEDKTNFEGESACAGGACEVSKL